MGLCCCGPRSGKLVKDMSTQTDVLPLVDFDAKQRSIDNEAKYRCSLESALRLVQQAVEADRARNYEEALGLYQHALVYFLESLNYEADSDVMKNKILSKCKQYLDRAEKLAEYLQANNLTRKTKPSSLSDVSSSVSQWIDCEGTLQLESPPPRSALKRMYHSIIRNNRKRSQLETTNDFLDLPNSSGR